MSKKKSKSKPKSKSKAKTKTKMAKPKPRITSSPVYTGGADDGNSSALDATMVQFSDAKVKILVSLHKGTVALLDALAKRDETNRSEMLERVIGHWQILTRPAKTAAA